MRHVVVVTLAGRWARAPNVFALFMISFRKDVNLDATWLAELTNTFLVLLTHFFSRKTAVKALPHVTIFRNDIVDDALADAIFATLKNPSSTTSLRVA